MKKIKLFAIAIAICAYIGMSTTAQAQFVTKLDSTAAEKLFVSCTDPNCHESFQHFLARTIMPNTETDSTSAQKHFEDDMLLVKLIHLMNPDEVIYISQALSIYGGEDGSELKLNRRNRISAVIETRKNEIIDATKGEWARRRLEKKFKDSDGKQHYLAGRF